jgi:hypothetical protein
LVFTCTTASSTCFCLQEKHAKDEKTGPHLSRRERKASALEVLRASAAQLLHGKAGGGAGDRMRDMQVWLTSVLVYLFLNPRCAGLILVI